jgi:hypothetical protein
MLDVAKLFNVLVDENLGFETMWEEVQCMIWRPRNKPSLFESVDAIASRGMLRR